MIIFSILGGILLFGAVLLFEDEFIHIVSISFTALILTELIMIAFTVRTWHCAMVVAEVISLGVYLISVMLFPGNFGKKYSIHLILHFIFNLQLYILNKLIIYNHCFLDTNFMTTWGFIWKVLAITAVSCVPLYIMKLIRKKVAPSSYQKLT